jgi:TolA-binding protein
VKQRNGLPGRIRKFGMMGLFLLAGNVYGWTQAGATPTAQPTDALTAAVRELQEEVRELRNAVVELRSEAGQYRAETEQLRRELESSRSSGTAPEASAGSARSATSVLNPTQAAPGQDQVEGHVASLEESSQLQVNLMMGILF